MRKRFIYIHSCRPDDVLADDVFSQMGSLILTANTQLNGYIIQKLEEMGVEKVPIIIEDAGIKSPAQISYENLVQTYESGVESIKTVINDITLGKKLDIESIDNITESLYSEVEEKGNIIRCIIEIRKFDEYTYHHSINVSLYSMLIAQWLGMSGAEIRNILKTGLLHDVGKSRISKSILNKKGELTEQEFAEIKMHTIYSYDILKTEPEISDAILMGVLLHHEREDGSGYPSGITGNNIGNYAKIIAVADVYDAMTSERVFKKRVNPFDTFKMLQRTGLGHFDTNVLITFLQRISGYYIGGRVLLNNGKKGRIAYIPPYNISCPIIQTDEEYYDLSRDNKTKILELLEL